jgi:hypothetical protein
MKLNNLLAITFLTLSLSWAAYPQSGEPLKGIDRLTDPRFALTLSKAYSKDQDNKELIIELEIKNVSKETVRMYLENCGICFWSISVNRGPFFPIERITHKKICNYNNPIELEADQTTIKTIYWIPNPRYQGMPMYSGAIENIRVRYLLQRESTDGPALYLESNEVGL